MQFGIIYHLVSIMFLGENMSEKYGIIVFYLLILFALIAFLLLFIRFDLILIVSGILLIIIAFLLKYEFNLWVCFWKKP